MMHRTFLISLRAAARCAFPCRYASSSRQLVIGSVRTLATRCATTDDVCGHGKEHSGVKHDTNNDAGADTTSGGWPHPIHASPRLSAKKSIFIAHASRLASASPASLRAFLDHLTAQPALKRATHCMYAWRVVVSPASPGAGSGPGAIYADAGPGLQAGAILTGHNDGGENGAGERLARLLEATGSMNVVVVVSRWYGGVKLGSERWKMISGVAKDALAQGDFREGTSSTGNTVIPANVKAKGSDNKKQRKK